MTNVKAVRDIYQKVVNDVLEGVREAFVDEGSDEQVLHELKQMWEGRLAQSKALEDVPKLPIEIAVDRAPAHQPPPNTQQLPVHRAAPPAHQHHQQPMIAQQMPQATLSQAVRHPVTPMLNLQNQLVALTQHQARAAMPPGGLAMTGGEFGQQLRHFIVPSAQNQLMMQSSGHIVQRPTQQIQIGGQTFTLAAATPQQQLSLRPIDPQSAPCASQDSVIQLDGTWDTGLEQFGVGISDVEEQFFVSSEIADTSCRYNGRHTSNVDS